VKEVPLVQFAISVCTGQCSGSPPTTGEGCPHARATAMASAVESSPSRGS